MTEEFKTKLVQAWSKIVDGWCTQEKAIQLAELIETHMPEIIVEVGIFSGKSLIPMAMAGQQYGAEVWGIDPWTVEACVEGSNSDATNQYWRDMYARHELERIRIEFIRDLERNGVSKTVRVLMAHDLNAMSFFGDDSIGLLHLDSNHSPEVSLRSVEDWFNKVIPTGIFVMDDIDWPEQKLAVDWLRSNQRIKIVSDNQKHIVCQKL